MIGNYDLDKDTLWIYVALILGGYWGYAETVKYIKPEPDYATITDGTVNDPKATIIVAAGTVAGAAVATYATAKVIL